MKKLLLGLGAFTSVAAPVVAVVSCGFDNGRYTVPEFRWDQTDPLFTDKSVLTFLNANKDGWARVTELYWMNPANKQDLKQNVVLLKVPKTGFENISEYTAFKADPGNVKAGLLEITQKQ